MTRIEPASLYELKMLACTMRRMKAEEGDFPAGIETVLDAIDDTPLTPAEATWMAMLHAFQAGIDFSMMLVYAATGGQFGYRHYSA